jgi:hypothetical protein
MSEGIGVTQLLELNPDSVQQTSKRKPNSPPLDGSDDPRGVSKTPRLDQDQNLNSGHDSSAENGEKEKVTDKGEAKRIGQEAEKEPDKNLGHSKNVLADKGKGKMIVQEEEDLDQRPKPSSKAYVDKGKGKMFVEEEEDSSDDSDEDCVASGSDSEYSDDPLMEVDLNNILPSRTRRWAPPVPGAYLVPPDQDDDEDEDDDDVSDVGVADDDNDEDDDVNDSESE